MSAVSPPSAAALGAGPLPPLPASRAASSGGRAEGRPDIGVIRGPDPSVGPDAWTLDESDLSPLGPLGLRAEPSSDTQSPVGAGSAAPAENVTVRLTRSSGAAGGRGATEEGARRRGAAASTLPPDAPPHSGRKLTPRAEAPGGWLTLCFADETGDVAVEEEREPPTDEPTSAPRAAPNTLAPTCSRSWLGDASERPWSQ